jgi:Fe-S-cluster containining protein
MAIQPELRFECTKCGDCCRQKDMIVTLTASDILKLAIGLGFTSNELLHALDFYVMEKGKSIPDGFRDIPRIKTERGMAYVALKKLDDSSCVFLKDNLCMIHKIRPMVCSSFPFVFSKQNDEVSWSLHAKRDICPGIGEGNLITKEDLISMSHEPLESLEMYGEIAKIWNDSDMAHTAEGFLEFLLTKLR